MFTVLGSFSHHKFYMSMQKGQKLKICMRGFSLSDWRYGTICFPIGSNGEAILLQCLCTAVYVKWAWLQDWNV